MLAASAALAWLLSAGPLQGQVQPTGDVLTIDQATTLALQQNRSIQSSKLEVQKVEDSLAELRTRRRPALSLDFLEGRLLGPVDFHFPVGSFGVFPSTGPIPPVDAAVTTPAQWTSAVLFRVTQPITQLHQIGLGERQLELGRDLASERTRGQEQTVVNNVRRLYYGILQTQNAIETREQSLALNEEIDRLVRQYIAQGVALPSDGLEVQALMAKERTELLVSHDSRASLQEQLNALLGRDISTPFRVAEVPDFAGAADDMATLEARALERRPEVKQAALGLSQAQIDVRVKRAELIPDVSAMFAYLGLYRFEVLPPHVPVAGVMLTWEPFDWGRKRRDDRQKREDRRAGERHDARCRSAGSHRSEEQLSQADPGARLRAGRGPGGAGGPRETARGDGLVPRAARPLARRAPGANGAGHCHVSSGMTRCSRSAQHARISRKLWETSKCAEAAGCRR